MALSKKKKQSAKTSSVTEPDNIELAGRPVEQFSADIVPAVAEMLASRKGVAPRILSAEDVSVRMLEFDHFFLKAAFGIKGIPYNSLIEIGGKEHVGKSTFLTMLCGMAMRRVGAPCAMILTEQKPLLPERMMRCLSRDPKLAAKLLKGLNIIEGVHTLHAMVDALEDFVEAVRSGGTPLSTPIFVGVDTFSKLMSEGEAAGYAAYGDNLDADKKKKLKPIGSVSNLGHSKFAAAWSRRLPEFLSKNNVILCLVHHQNEKIEMNGGASFIPTESSDLLNDTFIGGRALRQLAALRLILAPSKQFKIGEKVVGQRIRGKVIKNSYGVPCVDFSYIIMKRHDSDMPGYIEPALNFDIPMAEWFAEAKILRTDVSNRKYSSKELGVSGLSAEDFSQLFHADPSRQEALGKQLKITGYYNVNDMVGENLFDTQAEAEKESVGESEGYNGQT